LEPSCCGIIDTTLKGLIINLDDDMKDELEYINTNYTPLYKKLGSVPMEGKIGLNFPRILGPWDSFGKHPKLKMLPEMSRSP